MKKRTAIIAASAVAAAATFYTVSMGTVIFYNSMVKDRRGDRNYAEGTESAKEPPEKATEYRKSAYPYNRWWSEQPLQKRHILSADGLKLEAKLLKADGETDRLAIVCHGHRCCSGEEGFICKMFHDEGYHVLAIEQRAHGVSEGSLIGFGNLEKEDVVLWARLMSEEFPECSIVLYGASMGGATVVQANSLEMPENVKCVVEDCGFSSISGVLMQKMKTDFSWIPFKRAVIGVSSLICRATEGFGFKEADIGEAAKRARLPLMVIHGQDDIVVPPWMGEEIYENCPTEKEILRVPDTGHNVSFFHAEDEYRNRVFGFINKHI